MYKKIIALSTMAAVVCAGIFSLLYMKNTKIPKQDITSNQPIVSEQLTSSNESTYIDKIGPMSRAERKLISDLVIKTIQDGFDGKKINYPDLKNYPAKWSTPQAVYTVLNIKNKLRSYDGRLYQKKPFLYAIIDSAYSAAFNNPNFPKLTKREFERSDFNFYISVIKEIIPLKFSNEDDIVKQLKPLKYGVILEYTQKNGEIKQGLFLPNMWQEYPRQQRFWQKLKRSAHIGKNFFSDKFKVDIFTVETIKDLDFTTDEDAERIRKAIYAYKKLFKPDGHILYEWSFRKGTISTKNNIVREMGSGYGLAYAYYMMHDKRMRPLLENFLQYAQSITIPHNNGKLIADKQKPHSVRIPAGASALALLAVLYYEQESKDLSFEQFRIDLKNALVSLYEPGVGVWSSPTDSHTSPYYDGETWLALTMYNIFYPEDTEVSNLLPDMNLTMYNKYHNKYLPNFFHWGTQAAAHQFANTQDELMYYFLKKQLNLYIDYIDMNIGSSSCAYAEGLGEAAMALKGKNNDLYLKVLERLETQQEVARILQDIPIKKNRRGRISPRTKYLLGLFMNNAKSMTTRNDVTQHCLSALLKSQQVFKEVQ